MLTTLRIKNLALVSELTLELQPGKTLALVGPSGSGKTTVTLGLLAALRARGLAVAPAKTGPDYIDRTILARAAGSEAINLDPWAMSAARLRRLADLAARGVANDWASSVRVTPSSDPKSPWMTGLGSIP